MAITGLVRRRWSRRFPDDMSETERRMLLSSYIAASLGQSRYGFAWSTALRLAHLRWRVRTGRLRGDGASHHPLARVPRY